MQHRNLNKRYNHDALSIKIKIPNLPSVKIMKYEVDKIFCDDNFIKVIFNYSSIFIVVGFSTKFRGKI